VVAREAALACFGTVSGLGYVSAGLALWGRWELWVSFALATLAFYVGSLGFLVWTLVGAIRLARASTPQVPRQAAYR
jgi:hypothetical protein